MVRSGSEAKATALAARPDSENSWISDGLPSSSRRRRRGEGRREGGGWREKGSTMEVNVGFDSAKKEIKVKRRRGPERNA